MAVTYPATLPAPELKGLKISPQNTRRKIQFDAGNGRSINHASNAPYIVECQFIFDAVQMDAFDYFFKFDANQGVNWISPAWLVSLGFNNHYMRFLQRPNSAKKNGVFSVSCLLEVVDQALQIPPIKVIWEVSNIQAVSFPPLPGLQSWYKANEDAHTPVYMFSDGEDLPNFISGSITLEVIQGNIAGDITYNAGLVNHNGFIAISTVANYYGYYGRISPTSNISLYNKSLCFVVEGNMYMESLYSKVYRDGTLLRVDATFFDLSYSITNLYPTFSTTGRDLLIITYGTDTIDFYLNGVLIHSYAKAVYSSTSQLVMTSIADNIYAYYYEILIYDRVLTVDEISSINAELTTKWQIE